MTRKGSGRSLFMSACLYSLGWLQSPWMRRTGFATQPRAYTPTRTQKPQANLIHLSVVRHLARFGTECVLRKTWLRVDRLFLETMIACSSRSRKRQQDATVFDFDDTILSKVFSSLGAGDLARASGVCGRWRTFIHKARHASALRGRACDLSHCHLARRQTEPLCRQTWSRQP